MGHGKLRGPSLSRSIFEIRKIIEDRSFRDFGGCVTLFEEETLEYDETYENIEHTTATGTPRGMGKSVGQNLKVSFSVTPPLTFEPSNSCWNNR